MLEDWWGNLFFHPFCQGGWVKNYDQLLFVIVLMYMTCFYLHFAKSSFQSSVYHHLSGTVYHYLSGTLYVENISS